MKTEVKELLSCWGEFEDVTRAASVLEWDQETYLPKDGASARGLQIATLASLAHERIVSPRFRSALQAVEKQPKLTPKEQAMAREARREHHRASKIPSELVREVAQAESAGLEAWKKAFHSNKWGSFSKNLTTLVRLKRRVAEAVGYSNTPYDALLDIYEPGATVEMLDPLFAELKDATIDLVQRIGASKKKPNTKLLTKKYAAESQLVFSRQVAEAMGFDFDKGRIDLSTHPFCSGFDPSDVRLTTRVSPADLRSCLFGTIHEAGHGLYEQGIDPKLVRTPIGHPVSLGIHESQSRLWENTVGRGRPFWKYFLPKLKKLFPKQLEGVKLAEFHFAVNQVRPSFIRVEADEVTYNLHIVLRYELEKGLMDGSIQPKDLPRLWNSKMKELLGITPSRDSEGVLQDIHWAMGLFGYFPTYSLGNLYSAQIYERAQRDIEGLERGFEKGQFVPLRDWLNRKIHRPGRIHSAAELIKRASGKQPSSKPFLTYVEQKYGELYDL